MLCFSTTILPCNIQLVFLNVAYMHVNFFIYRFMCKSKASISDNVKAVFYNVFLTVHSVSENIFPRSSRNSHFQLWMNRSFSLIIYNAGGVKGEPN